MHRFLIGVFMVAGFFGPAYAEQPSNELPAGAIARLGKVRYANVGRVLAVAFARDGKTLIAGAWDGSIWWWDVERRAEIRHIQSHTGPIRVIAFSHDGKLVASGGDDRMLFLWDAGTGAERGQLRAEAAVRYLAFSRDDKLLAYEDAGPAVHIWDIASKAEIRSIRLSRWAHAAFGFSPDARLFASTIDRYSIAIMEAATGKELHRLTPSKRWFGELAFSHGAGTIVAVSEDHIIRLCDVATGKELRPLGDWQHDSYRAVFSPDGRSIASAGDEQIHIWEVLTRGERCRFPCPDKQPFALAFSPDGRSLAQGSEDLSVLLWDLNGLQGPGGLPSMALTPGKLRALWGDLASTDATIAFRAMWTLAIAPGSSVSFLRELVRPVPPVDASLAARLVADLGSDQFQTRKEATERLERLADVAEPALRQALKGSALEQRQRIEALLEKIAINRETPPANRLREWRALEALERMATPQARAFLEELARGAPEGDLTQQAKAALERLGKPKE